MATSDEILAGGPGIAPTSSKSLGIPDTYTVTQGQRNPNNPALQRPASGPYLDPASRPVVPGGDPNAAWFPVTDPATGAGRYYSESDVFTPGIGRSADEIAEMQDNLIAAGLIGKGDKFRIGKWDDVTASAYRKALSYANQRGRTAGEAIDELMSQPLTDLGGGSATKPLQFQLPDRNDVKAVAGKVSRSVLGRGLDDAQKDAFADAYEQRLMEIQKQNYQNAAIEGAKLIEDPDPERFLADQVRQANPNEAGAHDYASTYSQFTDLISSSAASARSGL